jgi:hypothetical protein
VITKSAPAINAVFLVGLTYTPFVGRSARHG